MTFQGIAPLAFIFMAVSAQEVVDEAYGLP